MSYVKQKGSKAGRPGQDTTLRTLLAFKLAKDLWQLPALSAVSRSDSPNVQHNRLAHFLALLGWQTGTA